MFMSSSDENEIQELHDRLRYFSPLPILISIFVSAVFLGLAVNLLSGAAYHFLDLVMDSSSGASASLLVRPIIDVIVMILCFGSIALLSVYLFGLSQQQAPRIQRVIILLLPFEVENGKVRLQEIPRLYTHRGMRQILNWAVERGPKSSHGLSWHANWVQQNSGTQIQIQGDAVTILYDCVEWILIREIDDYGKHMASQKVNAMPGDDLLAVPLAVTSIKVGRLYHGVRPNYLWEHSNQADQQVVKLPRGTEFRLRTVAPDYHVKKFGKEPVREIYLTNPAGMLVIKPSQIWSGATSQQARGILHKLLGPSAARYPLEMQVSVTVHLHQIPFIWPWYNKQMEAHQRVLLEMQALMVRHMDWQRYVEHDYERMIVDIRDKVSWLVEHATNGPVADPPQSSRRVASQRSGQT
jgi:hypothetical protein